jgi:hypothetical protein
MASIWPPSSCAPDSTQTPPPDLGSGSLVLVQFWTARAIADHARGFDLAVLLEQRSEVGEGRVGRLRGVFGVSSSLAWLIQVSLVLVIVAVNAEQFPVAAVRRVVVVVVVLVVDGELAHVGMVEFTRAASADPGEQFQRLAAVTRDTTCASSEARTLAASGAVIHERIVRAK